MNGDSFCVYLRGIRARDVEYRVLGDGRHWLDVTRDVALIVRLDDENLAETLAGLRKLAEAATAMVSTIEASREQ